jgi:hypothetical protein
MACAKHSREYSNSRGDSLSSTRMHWEKIDSIHGCENIYKGPGSKMRERERERDKEREGEGERECARERLSVRERD